jgi:hypothetical protein
MDQLDISLVNDVEFHHEVTLGLMAALQQHKARVKVGCTPPRPAPPRRAAEEDGMTAPAAAAAAAIVVDALQHCSGCSTQNLQRLKP